MKNNNNAKILGGLILLGFVVGGYFLFKKRGLDGVQKGNSTMKTILVFQDGELIKQIPYKNKSIAKKHYSFFMKEGILDPSTGNKVKNATFELL